MSWKVLITARTLNVDAVGRRALDLLRGAGCELIHPPKYGPLTEAELLPLLPGVDAVFASMDKFTATVLGSKEATSLKLVSRWGVGYDAIDVPAATKQGVVIAYTPGLLNNAVADYAMALLFALARRVHEGHLSMREGKWASGWGHDIGGKTLGIVGCGRIGQAVAKRASGFNMRLLGHDIAPNADASKLGIEFVPLDQLLAESDFISLHCALTPETRGLIGEVQLRKMKPSAYIINTARGAVLDEAALLRALKENWIAGVRANHAGRGRRFLHLGDDVDRTGFSHGLSEVPRGPKPPDSAFQFDFGNEPLRRGNLAVLRLDDPVQNGWHGA